MYSFKMMIIQSPVWVAYISDENLGEGNNHNCRFYKPLRNVFCIKTI